MVSWDAKEYITWLVKCHKILKYLQEFVMSHDMSKKVLETKPWNIKKAVCVLENSWKVLDSLWCPFSISLLSSWARFEFLLLWNLKDFFELCRLGRKLIPLISPFWELSSSLITLETFLLFLIIYHIFFVAKRSRGLSRWVPCGWAMPCTFPLGTQTAWPLWIFLRAMWG